MYAKECVHESLPIWVYSKRTHTRNHALAG